MATIAEKSAQLKKLGYNWGDPNSINSKVIEYALANPELKAIPLEDIANYYNKSKDSKAMDLALSTIAPNVAGGVTDPSLIKKYITSLEARINQPNVGKVEYNTLLNQLGLLNGVYQKQTGTASDYLSSVGTKVLTDKNSTAGDKLAALINMNKVSTLPLFTSDAARKNLDAYVASLEDPFKKSTEQVMASLNQRGLLNSGIQDKNIGELVAAYNQAKSAKASDLGTDKYNQSLQAAENDYNDKVNQYKTLIQTQLNNSGKTAEQFYAENQAAIDAKMQDFATQKQSAYENIKSNYDTTSNDYWNNLEATGNALKAIGSAAAGLYDKNNSTQSSTYNYSVPDYSVSNNNAINSLDKYGTLQYKNFDPWANMNRSYGNTIGAK